MTRRFQREGKGLNHLSLNRTKSAPGSSCAYHAGDPSVCVCVLSLKVADLTPGSHAKGVALGSFLPASVPESWMEKDSSRPSRIEMSGVRSLGRCGHELERGMKLNSKNRRHDCQGTASFVKAAATVTCRLILDFASRSSHARSEIYQERLFDARKAHPDMELCKTSSVGNCHDY